MASNRVVRAVIMALAAGLPAGGALAAAVESAPGINLVSTEPEAVEPARPGAKEGAGEAADAATSDAELLPPGYVSSFESLRLSGRPVSTGVSVHYLVPELAPEPHFDQRRDYWQRRFIERTVPPSAAFRLYNVPAASKTQLWKPLPLEVDDDAIPPRMRGQAFEDEMRFDDEDWFDPNAWKAHRRRCPQLVTEVAFEADGADESGESRGRFATMFAYVRNLARAVYFVVDGVFFGGRGAQPEYC
jgi:hypothetical protein